MFIRQESHAPKNSYGFIQYLAYFLYTPLYLAGPVVTFNCWISQVLLPPPPPNNRPISTNCLSYRSDIHNRLTLSDKTLCCFYAL